ncbi:ESPR-type extended signal peptide-containing protein [Paraburkholderia hayleyella]|uniref:ESPR-type extended signal peptide-containing protein n=1 Tax=Paraburkholderia hayleyella TaxID=2152889 RepID=UPI001290965A|nr:YadA-like family protein [Paraburkholderia hayleyella]
MNKVYKSVWNAAAGTYIATAETTKSRGKKSSTGSRSVLSAALASAVLLSASHAAYAATAPGGGAASGGPAPSGAPAAAPNASGGPNAQNNFFLCWFFFFCGGGGGGGSSTTTNNYYESPYVVVKGKGDKSDLPTVNGITGIAIGPNATVTTEGGVAGIAIGDHAQAGDVGHTGAVALGGFAKAASNRTVAIGLSSTASTAYAAALGFDSLATGDSAVAMGALATASGGSSVALGYTAGATGKNSVALGMGSIATASDSVALGTGSIATRSDSISVGKAGSERQITNLKEGTAGTDAVNLSQLQAAIKAATGKDVPPPPPPPTPSPSPLKYFQALSDLPDASAAATNSVAIGGNAVAGAADSVALGSNSNANRKNTISVGSVGAERQITNVLAGTADTDAANVGQVNKSIQLAINGGQTNVVLYDSTNFDRITLGGATTAKGPVALTNVKDGSLAATSSDAVNGAQVGKLDLDTRAREQKIADAMMTSTNGVVTALGGGAAMDMVKKDGTIIAPSYVIGDKTYSNVGDALVAAANGSGSAAVANVVKYDTTSHDKVTLGSTTGTGGTRLTNLQDGMVSVTSSDAITGGQLYGTARSVADALGGGSSVGIDGMVSKPAYTIDGTTYGDIGKALDAVNTKATSGSSNGVIYDTSKHDKLTLGGAGSTTPVALSNVADGTALNDAVNLGQLKAAGLSIDTSGKITNSFVSYDDTSKNLITLGGGVLRTRLTNVQDGRVSATSSDAITGGQLYGTAKSVADALGGGSSVNADGTLATPSYTISGKTYGDIGKALDAIGSTVTKIDNVNTNAMKYIKVVSSASEATATGSDSVAVGGLASAKGDNSVAIGSGARAMVDSSVAIGKNALAEEANVFSVGARGDERRIVNIADGTNAHDAATVGQLTALRNDLTKSSGPVSRSLAATDTAPVTDYIKVSGTVTGGATYVSPESSDSMAIGPKAQVSASSGIAVGSNTSVGMSGGTAVGTGANTSSVNSTAVGNGASTGAGSDGAVALGYLANAVGSSSLAVGSNATANTKDSIAIGNGSVIAVTAGAGGLALGGGARVNVANAVAIGQGSLADRANTVSVGNAASQRQIVNLAAGTKDADAVNLSQLNGLVSALGGGATISGTDGKVTAPKYTVGDKTYTDVASAIGAAAKSGSFENGVAYDSSKKDQLTLGGAGSTTPVTLSNVADGKATNDAVNLGQLKAAGLSVDTSGKITNSFVSYDDTSKGKITLGGGDGGTRLTNVQDGVVSVTSSDAITGGQLYGTAKSVADALGGGSSVGIDGGVSKPAYTIDGKTYADIGKAIDAVSAKASGGSVDGVIYDTSKHDKLTLGGASSTTPVTLSNVADGKATNDAVNLGQLKAAGLSVDTSGKITNSFVSYDDTSKGKITLGGGIGGTRITNVQDGVVSATSMDAINGEQLYGTAKSVADALGGGSSVSVDGTVSKPAYTIDGKTYADIGKALDAIGSTVTKIDGVNTNAMKYIKVVSSANEATATGSDSVAVGGLANAKGDSSVAIGAGARALMDSSVAIGKNALAEEANVFSVGARGDERRIVNIADGTNAHDAATVGQLTALRNDLTKSSGPVSRSLAATPVVTDYIAVSTLVDGGATSVAAAAKNSMAIGPRASAKGSSSMAVGTGAVTNLDNSTAVGSGATTSSLNNTAVGYNASTSASAENAVAIGSFANASAVDSLALGGQATTNAGTSIAIGKMATTAKTGTNSVALGANAVADRANTVSVGDLVTRRQIVNVAAGTATNDAVNVGQLSSALATTLGGGAKIDDKGVVVAPNYTVGGKTYTDVGSALTAVASQASTGSSDGVVYDTTKHDKLTLGGAGSTTPVTLSNVADGKATNDAVNLGQLKAAGLAVDTTGKITNSFVSYDDTSKGKITLGGGIGGTRITNVQDGVVSATSMDAINGEQLYGTAKSVADALGGGSGVGVDGTVSKPAYAVDGKTYADIGSAITAASKTGGSANGVNYDTSTHDKLTLGGVGSTVPVALTNLAAGSIATGSKDAITGGQLFDTATSVAAAMGGGAKVGADGKLSAPGYVLDGKSYTDVGTALSAMNSKVGTGSTEGVVYDTSLHDKLTLGGTNGAKPVTLSNVADGVADKDAVNLSQLKAAGLTVDTAGKVTNAFVSYDNASKTTATFNAGGAPTQLKNVAAGVDGTDAVNFAQMQSYVSANGGGANSVVYDDSTKGSLTLGGVGAAGPVRLSNVADGKDKNDAVTYGQFSDLQSRVNNLATTGGTGGTNNYITINGGAGLVTPTADGTDAIAIGNGASAAGLSSIALGARSNASADKSMSLGADSSATGANSVALGSGSVADRDNSVSVGAKGAERQITNVAAGSAPTDAVNVGQMSRAVSGVYQSMHDIDRNAAKGIAAASALNVVTPYLPGRTTLNAGVSNYRGQQAVGLGVSRWNDKGTINYNLGVSSSGGNSTIVRAGIGIVLGI